jgi:hypothetical protein
MASPDRSRLEALVARAARSAASVGEPGPEDNPAPKAWSQLPPNTPYRCADRDEKRVGTTVPGRRGGVITGCATPSPRHPHEGQVSTANAKGTGLLRKSVVARRLRDQERGIVTVPGDPIDNLVPWARKRLAVIRAHTPHVPEAPGVEYPHKQGTVRYARDHAMWQEVADAVELLRERQALQAEGAGEAELPVERWAPEPWENPSAERARRGNPGADFWFASGGDNLAMWRPVFGRSNDYVVSAFGLDEPGLPLVVYAPTLPLLAEYRAVRQRWDPEPDARFREVWRDEELSRLSRMLQEQQWSESPAPWFTSYRERVRSWLSRFFAQRQGQLSRGSRAITGALRVDVHHAPVLVLPPEAERELAQRVLWEMVLQGVSQGTESELRRLVRERAPRAAERPARNPARESLSVEEALSRDPRYPGWVAVEEAGIVSLLGRYDARRAGRVESPAREAARRRREFIAQGGDVTSAAYYNDVLEPEARLGFFHRQWVASGRDPHSHWKGLYERERQHRAAARGGVAELARARAKAQKSVEAAARAKGKRAKAKAA